MTQNSGQQLWRRSCENEHPTAAFGSQCCICVTRLDFAFLFIYLFIYFNAVGYYEGWNFNGGNYLFTTDTK